MQYKINLWKFARKIARQYVEQKRDEIYENVRRFSPIRTGTYQEGHRKSDITETSDTVSARVYNVATSPDSHTTSYAYYIEYWWRSRPVNWHIADGSIYYAKGAHVYERAVRLARENQKSIF